MRTQRTPLSRFEIAAVNRMLNAAGEVLVTRAMTKTCTPRYENKGWQNCWFTQMFGGKANLERLAEAHESKTGEIGFEIAIAAKLGIAQDDVDVVISLFDDHTGYGQEWGNSEIGYVDDSTVVKLGKVVNFLDMVERWLVKRGIFLNVTKEVHKKVPAYIPE